jgi:hypothetical protein
MYMGLEKNMTGKTEGSESVKRIKGRRNGGEGAIFTGMRGRKGIMI